MNRHDLARLLAFAFMVSVAAAAQPEALSGDRVQVDILVAAKDTDRWSPDIGSVRTRAAALEAIGEYLQREASGRLSTDEALAVTVTRFDRAGQEEPGLGPKFSSVRIVRDLFPPRIDLRFALSDGRGAVRREGERTLRDLNFLLNARVNPDDPLRYEKALIDDWLDREFPRVR
jgi:hypothetical protein